MAGSFCQFLPRLPAPNSNPKDKPETSQSPAPAPFVSRMPTAKRKAPVRKKPTREKIKAHWAEKGSSASRTWNIMYIDLKIREHLQTRKEDLEKLRERVHCYTWIAQHGVTEADRIKARRQTFYLRRAIDDIANSFELGYYIYQTQDLLEEYKSLASQAKIISFVTPTTTVSSQSRRKHSIACRYLRIASDYIDVSIGDIKGPEFGKPSGLKCPNCASTQLHSDDTLSTCLACGQVIEKLDDAPSFKDTDRINMSTRYTYSKRGHFVDAMTRFQGKQNTNVAPRVYNVLQQQMKHHNLTPGSVTKEQMYLFLSENGLSSYYDDINLIYHTITKTSPPDISAYEDRLLDMFDQQEEVYEKIKDPSRINSLNVNYKLFKLLQILGYPCTRHDFHFLKTQNKLNEHDEYWEEICKNKGWRFIPT